MAFNRAWPQPLLSPTLAHTRSRLSRRTKETESRDIPGAPCHMTASKLKGGFPPTGCSPPLRASRDNNKEEDAESQALSSRCRSAPNRKTPSGRTHTHHAVTHTPFPVRTPRERHTQLPQHRGRNEAARIIQRAWRRCVCVVFGCVAC